MKKIIKAVISCFIAGLLTLDLIDILSMIKEWNLEEGGDEE